MAVLIFYFLLFLSFSVEGLGVPTGRQIVYFIALVLPFLLLVAKNKPLIFPRKILILFLLFLALTFVSSLFSPNIAKSIEYMLFYLSCFSIFIFGYNNKSQIERLLLPFILCFGFIFSLYSTFIGYFAAQNLKFLVPNHGFQLVYSYTFSHNHLGDFLILPIIICLYFLLQKKYGLYSILTFIFFLPYFIFSYSRSAYIDLAIIGVIMFLFLRSKSTATKTTVLLLSAGLILTSMAVASSPKNLSSFGNLRAILVQKIPLQEKNLFGLRPEYVYQAASSIVTRPILGVGPGNFYLASIKYTKTPGYWTQTAHNIFLEILVENGVPAGIVFALIIFQLLRHSKKNLLFYLAFAMLLNFQTDYTYRIYSILLLFFTLLGLTYRGRRARESA